MSSVVTVVDYGMGNIFSVRRALEYCGAKVHVTSNPDDLVLADRLILPGVGTFGDGMSELKKRDLIGPINDFVQTGHSLLGICLGMQMLVDISEEFGCTGGLQLITGKVVAIPSTKADGSKHKIPHIGWSSITPPPDREDVWKDTIFEDIPPYAPMYFVHSYTVVVTDPSHRLADSNYNGRPISAAISRDNIIGTQFHPEKSGEFGLRVIRRFLNT